MIAHEKHNAPVNVDAILQTILGRGGERFGMAAVVLRGQRIIAQGYNNQVEMGFASSVRISERMVRIRRPL